MRRRDLTSSIFLYFQVALLLRGSSTVKSQPRSYSVYQTYPSTSSLNEVQYDYRYAIDDAVSGVISDRWEQRIGEFVKGSYSLLEPDGKIRTVDYEVDGKRGFHAIVHTKFPASVLLSNQQLEKSRLLHPEPDINLHPGVPPPPDPYHHDPHVVPPNYHAIRAAAFPYSRVKPSYSTSKNNYAQYQPQYSQYRGQVQQTRNYYSF